MNTGDHPFGVRIKPDIFSFYWNSHWCFLSELLMAGSNWKEIDVE